MEAAAKSFKKYFSLGNKPIETKIVSDEELYYIYILKDDKEFYVMKKGIWKAEKKIRGFYLIIMHLTKRANKIAKKGAWRIDKARRWIMKQLSKKNVKTREMEDFINAIEFGDEEMMTEFLKKEIISYEVVEDE